MVNRSFINSFDSFSKAKILLTDIQTTEIDRRNIQIFQEFPRSKINLMWTFFRFSGALSQIFFLERGKNTGRKLLMIWGLKSVSHWWSQICPYKFYLSINLINFIERRFASALFPHQMSRGCSISVPADPLLPGCFKSGQLQSFEETFFGRIKMTKSLPICSFFQTRRETYCQSNFIHSLVN